VSEPGAAPSGLSGALARLAASAVDLVRTRAELAAVEFDEARELAKDRLALLVVAVVLGFLVGLGVTKGAGGSLAPGARQSLAVALSLTALAVAVGVNWALSGMYLGPLDYLVQVYGLLVPLQAILAAAGAIAGTR